MPQHWRCSNGHAWTGDLGALTYCPDCGSADVYEVRPQYESLPSAPATAPATDAADRIYVQPATVKIGPPAEANVGDTMMQAPVISANVGDTLTQPAVNVGDTFIQPADAGTTLVQAYVPDDDGTTLMQAPVFENGDEASGETLLQTPRKPKDDSTLEMLIPNADGTIHQPGRCVQRFLLRRSRRIRTKRGSSSPRWTEVPRPHSRQTRRRWMLPQALVRALRSRVIPPRWRWMRRREQKRPAFRDKTHGSRPRRRARP